jgi:hypothetical protein
MPSLSLTAWLVAGAIWVGSTLGAYFYGHNEGYNAALAEQAAGIQKALTDFEQRVATTADAVTKAALAEFKEKTALLKSVGDQLDKAQGTINAASAKLSASLRGSSCVLTPPQRRLLECIRRPDTEGCAPASAAVQPAVPR